LREILEGLKNKVEAIQLPADPQALVVLTTNRNEARALQRMAEASIKRLEIDIIPGYQAKGLDDYVARSKEKLATLKSLTEKIGRALA
jgi:aryl-alcohol dehydrogenase-like predicted oxidoreductase